MNDAGNNNETGRPRVLFVDSSRLMRKAAERILGNEFRVIPAESTDQAWVILLDDPLIQVVFHDLASEDRERTLSLLERIRSSDSNRVQKTPVVLITGADESEEYRARTLKSGATDFIDKPFRPSELLARARTHATSAEAALRLRMLRHSHNRDVETGLGNRRYFFERLSQSLSFARRHGQPLSFVHIHLDGLDDVFKNKGKEFRLDQLARLGRMLARAVRHEDTVYRSGPETFSFILPGTNEAGAEAVRCRLAPELDAMGLLEEGNELNITTRFVVQVAEFEEGESMLDCARRIRKGMGTLLLIGSEQQVEPEQAPGDDLQRLLEIARNGNSKQLHEHLPALIDRLRPLLELAEELGKTKPKTRSG